MTTIITNITELQAISSDLTGSYILGNDIPASGTAFTPLGTFTGTLDGAGYKIKNLTITVSGSGYQYGALITTNQGTVQNLGLADCAISVTSSAYSYAAGVACLNDGGTISNCYVTGTIAAITTTTLYYGYAGGIAAWNQNSGTITKSYSTATISITTARHGMVGGLVALNVGSATISESYATGDVTVSSSYTITTAYSQAGGLVAWNGYDGWGTGIITDCYAKGDATATGESSGGASIYAGGLVMGNYTGSTITNSYSIGATTGADGDGGLCQANSGTITDCFWDTTTSSDAASDGGTGKTTAQMKLQATYTNWDFVTIWEIISTANDGYPRLVGGSRCVCIPDVLDDHGRVAKGARVIAYRNDTHAVVAEGTIDANGNATICELPNDVDVSFHVTWGGSSTSGNERWFYSDIVGVSEGGTGSSNALDGRTNLGLGTSDSPQFTAVNIGHATDTTVTRVSAALIAVEGDNLIRASDVDDTPVNEQTAVPVSSNWAFDHNARDATASVQGHATAAQITKLDALGAGADVVGPASSTDNAIARFHETTGKIIQDYTSNPPTISDSGDITVDGDLTADNIITAGNVDGVDISAHDVATTGVHGVTGTIVGTSDSQTLTTKTLIASTNVVEEISTVASDATPNPTGGSLRNFYTITALAAAATFAAPSGTPANDNKLTIRIKDNGTARTLAWNAIYRALEFALPTTTVASDTIYLGFIYNSTDSKWDMVAEAAKDTALTDADADTGIETERTADDDILYLKTGGVDCGKFSAVGIQTLAKQPLASGRQTSDQTIPTGTPYVPLFFDTEETDIQGEMDLASGDGTAEVGTAGTTLHDDGVFAGAASGDNIWNTTDETYWVIDSVTSNDEVETTAGHDIAVGETFTWFRAKYTATEDGTYLIAVKILMQAMADAKYAVAAIYVDGAQVMNASMYCSVINSYPGPEAVAIVELSAAQVVEGYVYHNHGSDIDTRGLVAYDTRYNITKLA